MRPKEKWSEHAILADIINRLGLGLAKSSLWEKYLFLCKTVGAGCELADKCSMLMFNDENIKPILKELDDFYGRAIEETSKG